MYASVLARDNEHFAQGAFCPDMPNATPMPRFFQDSLTIIFGRGIASGFGAATIC
jgi:hypothetical protein